MSAPAPTRARSLRWPALIADLLATRESGSPSGLYDGTAAGETEVADDERRGLDESLKPGAQMADALPTAASRPRGQTARPQAPTREAAAKGDASDAATLALLDRSPAALDAALGPATAARPQRSLFGEILDWMMAPLLLLWPVSVAITFVIARSIADAPFDRSLEERARALAQQVQYVGNEPRVSLDRLALAMLSGDPRHSGTLQVLDARGVAVLGDIGLPAPSLYDFPQVGVVKLRSESHRGEELRIAYQYVEPPDAPAGLGPLLVQVAETPDERTLLANEIIKGVILPQFLILPMALGLVWFGLGRGLRPLQRTQEKIRERGAGDLSPLEPSEVPQEITPLVDAFNDLLRRLGLTFEEQRRFIADAAHQMKTPLAGLQTQAELALRQSDPAEVRRSLEQLATGSARAARLVSQLLAMARVENPERLFAPEQIDLNALARSVLTEWADTALARGLDIGFDSDDAPAPIAGHPFELHEAIGNLLDNALRYTPPPGVITVRVRSGPRQVILEVEDDGPGIPSDARELVFERFYRVLGTQADGSGLGMAIVRGIVQRHGAEIHLRDSFNRRPGRPGTLIRLVFAKLRDA